MYLQCNAFELGGYEFLNDIEKHKMISDYIDAVLLKERNPNEENLEFSIESFAVKINGKFYSVVQHNYLIPDEKLNELKKEIKKLPKIAKDIDSPFIMFDVDCFERTVLVEINNKH